MKIVFAGAGNVARHLAPALQKAGHVVVQVFSRSEESSRSLAKKLRCSHTTNLKELAKADVLVIAMSDTSIPGFVKKIPAGNFPVLVHTSGSVPLKVFGKKVSSAGVLYPVQTFSRDIPLKLSTVPFCIEAGSASTLKQIKTLASSVSDVVISADSDKRKSIHLAAVFANNFSNHMFDLASVILDRDDIPFSILHPLIAETARKAVNAQPSAVQTGPARRGDSETIDAHLRLLKKEKALAEIYRRITESIERLRGPRL